MIDALACVAPHVLRCAARACVCGGFLGTMHCGCEVGLGCVCVAGHMKMDLVAQDHGGVEAGCARTFCLGYDMAETQSPETLASTQSLWAGPENF